MFLFIIFEQGIVAARHKWRSPKGKGPWLTKSNKNIALFFAGSLTPLMVISQAVKKGEENIVKCAELLITSGSDVNSHDKYVLKIDVFVCNFVISMHNDILL